jgi:hypothetical protein
MFCWTAQSDNGVAAYRYGWDILDLNDPEGWDTDYIPYDGSETCSPVRTFLFGTHTFNIEVVDNLDRRSRVEIIINTIQGFVSFDIMPGSCRNPLSPRKRGLIRMVIPGIATPGLDVRDIDVSSVRLWFDGTTIAPLSTGIGDIARPVINGDLCDCPRGGADGIDDLVLQFSAKEINDALGPVTKGEVREIAITGFVQDWPQFWLVDCVTIVGAPVIDELPRLQR